MTLIDTISDMPDTNTFEFLGSSHPVSLVCSMTGVVQFRFENTNLLWSCINELANHGFVSCRIQPEPNLQLPMVVTNTAYICFDFNPAIITKEVWNTVENSFTGSIDIIESQPNFKIFPNPSGKSFSILVPLIHEKYSRTLYNFTGKIILTEKNVSSGEKFLTPEHCSGICNGVLKYENGLLFQLILMTIKISNIQMLLF